MKPPQFSVSLRPIAPRLIPPPKRPDQTRSKPVAARAELVPTAVADAIPPLPPAPPPTASAPTPVASVAKAAANPSATASSAAGVASPLVAASSTLVPATPVDSWPPDTRVQYRMTGNYRGPIAGTAQVQWQRESDRYQIQIAIRLAVFFSMSMTSQGRVLPDQLWPERYEELTVNKTLRQLSLDRNELVFSGDRRMPRPAGVQDTASQFVELSHRFSQAPQSLVAGSSVKLWLARPGGADPWTYDVSGPESLQTDQFGPIETLHLTPRPLAVPRGPITAEFWFAPSLQYLPVHIKIHLDSDTWLDLQMTQIDQAARQPTEPRP